MHGKPVTSSIIISETLKIFNSMLVDIENARNYVYIETYKFESGPIGIAFRDKLTQRAKAGVKIKLLIDAWGSYVSEDFFKEMISFGGEVKFFRKLKLSINSFKLNHERDHRKIVVIDNNITYISSLNFTSYCINWREMSIRLTGNISKAFKTIFNQNYNLKNTYKFNKKRLTRPLRIGNFEIIRDVPSVVFQRLRKKTLHMVNSAQKEIIVETPYFLPTRAIRDAMVSAVSERAVDIRVIMPYKSDVKSVNILKDFYIGKLHQAGIKFFFYGPHNLHAKMLIVDDHFYVGTSNFDYRSFRYQFEVGLVGKDQGILQQLQQHNNETMVNCVPFDYEKWEKRPAFQKILEVLLIPLRHFL